MINFDTYVQDAIRTAKRSDDLKFNLVHAALGLSGEAGEFTDAVKKAVIYNRDVDRTNLIEELGDALWYIALAAHSLGVPMSHIAQLNIDKLRKRYPDAYSDHHAAARLDKADGL